MGKRAGNAVDLDDLVADIGPDAMRLLSLVNSLDQATTVDLDKVRARVAWTARSSTSRWPSARIGGIGREAAERGMVTGHRSADVDLSLLTHQRELDVMRCLAELPEVVADAASPSGPPTR